MEIIAKLKNLSLSQVNKNLIFVAILSLLFMIGNFACTYIPKPFEIIFLTLFIFTVIDMFKNNKIREFFTSLPINTRIALFCLVLSILFGWVVSLLNGIPSSFNMFLEFGSFLFSVGIFWVIVFYIKNDDFLRKKYFFALLIPSVFVICIIFPIIAYNLALTNGTDFLGFTSNQNIISKMLLIPAISFIVMALFEHRSNLIKFFYALAASGTIALLFWVSSRAALFSLIIGSFFVGIIFCMNNFSWKKLFKNLIMVIIIITLGFLITPSSAKRVALSRFLNLDRVQPNYADSNFYVKSLGSIIKQSYLYNIVKPLKPVVITIGNQIPETRFQFWPIYLKEIFMNPLGIGPNTHVELKYLNGGINTNIGPHNSYLEIWLWGGLLGLFSFVYLIFNAFDNSIKRLKVDFNSINLSLLGIIVTMSIVIIANDSVSLPCLWIVMALSF